MAEKIKENIDHNEVEKFNLLAHKWWDKTSEFKPLHDINPLRLNFITEKIKLSGARVLDVGCGGGILSESLAKEGAQVVGIDQGENVIRIAKLHMKESNLVIEYKQLNIDDYFIYNIDKFEFIYCIEML
jgi:2-polyprenyl-6-hydroxyphenyl methylase/3-demethylubiquinone-9 3-methyltransferase